MTTFIEYLKYALLGLIQGIAEILPISSSSHLMLFQHLLKVDSPGLTFEMFTNMASFIALLVFFRKEILSLLKSFFSYIFKKNERSENKKQFYYVIKLVIAILPIGILGLIFKDQIENLKSLLFVGIGLFITGSLLLVTYFTRNLRKELAEVSFASSALIGFSQAFHYYLDFTSGSTIVSGRATNLSLKTILTFSFLSYVLISLPISVLSIYDALKGVNRLILVALLQPLSLHFSDIFTAKIVMKRLKIKHLIYFGIYCLLISSLRLFYTLFKKHCIAKRKETVVF